MNGTDLLQGWEQYPACLSQSELEGVDLEVHRQMLLQEGPRIFSGHENVELWKRGENNQGDEHHPIVDPLTKKRRISNTGDIRPGNYSCTVPFPRYDY